MTAVKLTADSPAVPLDTLDFPLWGSRLIEASAGTGKTYTIASLYVRLVLGHGVPPEQRALTPPDILVVTFTRAATQELRDRIRRRLTEAAGCFLQDNEGDEFLRRLRDEYPADRWPACARLLQIAAEWMDDAAVSTIDAWCYRMLREHAFDSDGLFEVEMDVDSAQRVAEATRDYWRLFIAPLPPRDLARVLQVIAAHAVDWRSRADCDGLASILHRRWLSQVGHFGSPDAPAGILARIGERSEACKAQWRAWVPDMREHLQTAYDANRYNKAKLKISHWNDWLDKLAAWAEAPDARLPFELKSAAWARLTPEGLAEVWKDGDPPGHPAFDAMACLRDEILTWDADATGIFPHAACWVEQRVAELREQRAMLDFGGLLEQLDAALGGPNGEKLARTIRAQFPAALIDEFQDTNPVQYRLFDRIYNVSSNDAGSLLALIGDPKQAIYRFRGADIHAYLAARQDCAGRLYTLGSNHRSTPGMVAAVNHLFSAAEDRPGPGAFLFRRSDAGQGAISNPVPFLPVNAAAQPGEWRVEGKSPAALSIWFDTALTARGACAAAVAEACASEILRLLQLGAEGRAGFQVGDEFRALRPRDIAILVNNRTEAAGLRVELAGRGIRSVYLSDESSVYHSAAALDVLAWLRACAEPENGGHVRAALATSSLGLSWSCLDAFVHDELLWEDVLERFAGYKEQWRRRGVLPMLRRFLHEFGVPARLFAEQFEQNQEGERRLTDLLHLAELLQAASVGLDGEHALIRYLEACIEAGGEADIDGDASRMRLESDAGLVQIVTVHKSKGLEYPLVFYPHAYQGRPESALTLPVSYRDRQGHLHVLASLTDATHEQQQEILDVLEQERLAEDLRKLYVALTRARYATWIALAPVDTLGVSASGHLLGGPLACAPEALEASLADLAGNCRQIEVGPFPQPLEGRYVGAQTIAATPVWRNMARRVDQRWSMSSYSALANLALQEGSVGTSPDDSRRSALPDEARLETFLEMYAAEDAAAEDEDANIERLSNKPSSPGAVPVGIHAFPRGAAPGSFLHDLLEWTLRQGPRRMLADPDGLHASIERRCRSRDWETHAGAVTEWIVGFVTQAFDLDLPGIGRQSPLVLADLGTALPEMEFWFGVRQADLPRLDRCVAAHFLPGRRRTMIDRGRLNGMLRGFVDLVFEHDGRYYVADYKSNWLGPDDTAYHAEAIADAMLAHRYELQAAIYLLALHRLLKARLGEHYDYEQHVGGALLFFLRGREAPGRGVQVLRPSAAVIEQLDDLFEGREHEVEA